MRYITIKDKQYAVYFSFSVLKKIMAKYSLSRLVEFDTLMNTIEIDHIPWVLSLGIEKGCKKVGESPIELKAIQVAFEDDITLMTKTIEYFGADLSGEKEDDKKKPITHKG